MWNNASSVSMIACHSYLVSRELIAKSGGWNEQLTANDDGEFFARILLCCGKVLFAENAYAYYRTGRYSSMSRTISRRNVESHLESYRLHIKNALPIDSSIQMRTALCHNLSYFMYLYYYSYPDLVAEAKRLIVEMLGMRPIPEGSLRTQHLARIIGYEPFLKLRKLLFKR